jgi:hypothetical protein
MSNRANRHTHTRSCLHDTRTFACKTCRGTVTRTEAVACDRGDLNTGIVHFGVGGFHRSHQQVSFVSEFTRFGNVRADPARGGAPNATFLAI